MNKVRLMQEAARCLLCENAPCTAACHAGDPARAVRAILFRNEANAGQWFAPCSEEDLPSLETTFCGLRCENPFFLASSAICTNYEMVAAEADRDTVVYPVIDRDLCVGCGRCYISCRDGGHQAIAFGEDRKPRILGDKCVGCHLCRLICRTGAIGISKRVPKRKKA